MFYLTVSQILKASKKHKYLLLRKHGVLVGINSKSVPKALEKKKLHGSYKTEYTGFRPCGFQEYITEKVPFI